MSDLFQTISKLPKRVQDVLAKYETDEPSQEVCEALFAELEIHGYTFDYGLDCVPVDLTRTKNTTPFEYLKSNVHHSSYSNLRHAMNYFEDGIAIIEQKQAKNHQTVFKADDFDRQQFGVGLNEDEVLVRLSTPLSTQDNLFNRTIAKVNLVTGKIAFVSQREYEEENIIKWERPLMFKFINIVSTELEYFNVF